MIETPATHDQKLIGELRKTIYGHEHERQQLDRQLRLAELSNNALRSQVVKLKDQSRKRLKRAQDAEATVRQLRRQIAGVITRNDT